ncbi:hypothetical protein [Reinekea sp. G2M2-21]|uniref:hypothetical protein n=1 Tax=Reinekea sp. G2M2-21 TaxID=2788942 RepID=UPI0018AA2843|nr:hypothetical protein [Reinekea sp. G2M2-21]
MQFSTIAATVVYMLLMTNLPKNSHLNNGFHRINANYVIIDQGYLEDKYGRQRYVLHTVSQDGEPSSPVDIPWLLVTGVPAQACLTHPKNNAPSFFDFTNLLSAVPALPRLSSVLVFDIFYISLVFFDT